VRNWLFVEDFAAAVAFVLEHGGAATPITSAVPTSATT